MSRTETCARRDQSVVGLLAPLEVVILRRRVLIHLAGRNLDQVLEESLVVLAFVADSTVLLLRFVLDRGIHLAALTSVRRRRPVRQTLLLRRAFNLILCVQLAGREQWALTLGEVLVLGRQRGCNFLAHDRRPHAVGDFAVQIRGRVFRYVSEARRRVSPNGQPNAGLGLLRRRWPAVQILLAT